MDKQYEMFKDILEDQIKQIVKKGDISPTELENVYRASAIVLDLETRDAMKKAEKQQSQGQQDQQGQGANAPNGGYSGNRSYGSYNMRGENSNHYPWYMYYGDGTYDMSGNSYGPVWNKEHEKMMHEMSNDGRSYEHGQNSRDYSNRGSYNRGQMSRDSYDGAYDGAYDGSYEGAYDGAYDASNDSSYRRGRDARTGRYVSRDRGYSRAMDKERMIGKLEDMMDDAPSEKERRALQQCVDKLERQ